MTEQLPGLAAKATAKLASGERQSVEDLINQVTYCLHGPFVYFPVWGPEVVTDHRHEIILLRAVRVQEVFRTKECIELEALLYISGASMAFPMREEWFRIFAYLFQRYKPEAQIPFGPSDAMRDEDWRTLARLRQWIFRQQMERLKQMSQEAKKGE